MLEKTRSKQDKLKLYKSIINKKLESNPESALKTIEKYENYSKMINDKNSIVHSETLKGIAYGRLGEYEKSNEILSNAIIGAREFNNENYEAQALINMGLNFLRIGLIDKAIENLSKAENLSKKNHNEELLGSINISMGILMKNVGKFDLSIKYLNLAEDYFKIKNDESNLSTVYNNLTTTYLAKKDSKTALEYLLKAIRIYEKLKENSALGIGYHNLGAIYYEKGNYSESLKWLEKSLKIKIKQKNKVGMATTYLAMGELFIATKDYHLSKSNLNNAVNIFKETNSLGLLMNAYQLMDSVYKITGDYKSAYHYSNEYYAIKDTLRTIKTEKALAEMNIKYEIVKKDKANSELTRKSDRQNYIIIFSLLGVIIITIFSFLLFMKNRSIGKVNRELTLNKNIIEEQNCKLSDLNSMLVKINEELKDSNNLKDKFFSIISHDLRSPVSSLYQLIDMMYSDYKVMSEDERVESLMYIKASAKNTFDLLQNLLTWSRAQLNKIEFKTENFKAYDIAEMTVSIMKSSAEIKGITIENIIDTSADIFVDAEMISSVIRNLISNSIKFTNPGGKIVLNLSLDGNGKKLFSVSDNGVGMTNDICDNLFRIDKAKSMPGTNNETGTGLGLLLCKEFVAKHGGRIWAESEVGKGSTFYFTV